VGLLGVCLALPASRLQRGVVGNCSFLRKMPPRLPAARPCNPCRFSGTEGAQTALRCEPLNQEYDPLKGDSLVAATRTEKGLDYVRL